MSGLQKQHVLINFGQGMDTKTDPKLVVTGTLTSLVNAVFKKIGRIDKRNGNTLLSASAFDRTISAQSFTLSDASALGVFNDELLQYNKQMLYSYSDNIQSWASKGACVSASVTTKSLVEGTSNINQADWAYLNGIGLFAYEDSRGGIRASVVDMETGALLWSDIQISSTGIKPRCIAFNGLLYAFHYDAGQLIGQYVNPLLPTQFSSQVVITSDVNTSSSNFDVLAYNDARIAFAYDMQSATNITFGFLDANLNSLSTALPNSIILEAATDCITLVIGPTNTIFLAFSNSSVGLKVAILNNGGSVITAAFQLDSYTTSVIRNITGYLNRDHSGVTFFYEITTTTGRLQDQYTKKVFANKNGTGGTPAVFLRSVGLFSRAFSFYFDTETVDHAYVCITHSSPLQSSYFIARDDGLIVATMQYTTGSGITSDHMLGSVYPTNAAGTEFTFPILNSYRLVSQDGALFSLYGLSQTSIDFDAEEQFNSAALGNNLHIAGGVLNMYDGQSVVEHGFLLYPETLDITQSGSTGVNTGSYNYAAIYEWTDNYGQFHRSAPSTFFPYSVTSGPATVSVQFPTLRLTRKTAAAGRSEVVLVLYRTTGESGTPGDILYRVSPIKGPTYNDTTVDYVTLLDTVADADLISNEILYDTGGELDNIPAPSSKYINVFANRIVLSGLEQENTVWTSKIWSYGNPVSFNNQLIVNVPPQGDGITSLAVLDDKLIIFKQDRLFIIYGTGPDNTGGGTAFPSPQLVSTDVGCPNSNSVVRSPTGIMFKSLKGIYLLDSSLTVSYIGAPVEDYNSYEITAAVLKHDVNQVRFATNQNTTLVYDYYAQKWATFGNYSVLDAVVWNQEYVFIDSKGEVFYEDLSSYKDNGAGIQLALTTGWITFDTIIGFQRIYKISFIGEFKSDHKLRIRVAYDFSNAYTSTYIFDTATGLGVEKYGDSSPYGNETPYGGINTSYRFSASLDRQKCQAIKFEIMDLTTSASTGSGEALNITGLGVVLGVKGQVGKFREQQQISSV